ncbi:hypothetical protein Q7A53_01395 [Halobacillus rhizosphaerae]|uniref:hypothetical protein n=1 Tax=Halobacillus rhizosphaerae TaxID=3064889 RepID=UPI00398B9565
MKWLMILLIGCALFIFGAIYGIQKNAEKYEQLQDSAASLDAKNNSSHKEGQVEKKVDHKVSQPASKGVCQTSLSEEKSAPLIVRFAVGLGQWVSACFDLAVLILSQMLHSGP